MFRNRQNKLSWYRVDSACVGRITCRNRDSPQCLHVFVGLFFEYLAREQVSSPIKDDPKTISCGNCIELDVRLARNLSRLFSEALPLRALFFLLDDARCEAETTNAASDVFRLPSPAWLVPTPLELLDFTSRPSASANKSSQSAHDMFVAHV